MEKLIENISKNNKMIANLVLNLLQSSWIPTYLYPENIHKFHYGYLDYDGLIQIQICHSIYDDTLYIKILNGTRVLEYQQILYESVETHAIIIDLYKTYLEKAHEQFLSNLKESITKQIEKYNN